MFRDESSKVIRRAHKKWGIAEPADEAGPSSASPTSSGSPASIGDRRGSIAFTESSLSPTFKEEGYQGALSRIPMVVQPTDVDIGTRFYVDKYIIGYPQEPETPADFHTAPWFSSPVISDIMSAVGLAAQANLTGNKALKMAALERYSSAVTNTRKLIANPAELDPPSVMRSVVLLAMYEVVSGTAETDQSIRQHILGALILLNQLIPRMKDPVKALRGVVQLCYSIVVPCYLAGVSLPGPALKYIKESGQGLAPAEKAATDLLVILSNFIQFSNKMRQILAADGTREAAALLKRGLQLEGQLATWERAQLQPGSIWNFTTKTANFPPQAAFRGQYHLYAGGMWTALVWNNYRWARILINESILDLVHRFPASTETNTLYPGDSHHLEVIKRHANDILVAVPTHYRHPAMGPEQRALLDQTFVVQLGHTGGSTGVPILMVQLQVASCAPGVPREYGEWTLAMFETIWRATGMLQAKNLGGVMSTHLDKNYPSPMADGGWRVMEIPSHPVKVEEGL